MIVYLEVRDRTSSSCFKALNYVEQSSEIPNPLDFKTFKENLKTIKAFFKKG